MFHVVMVDPTSGVFDASQHAHDVVQVSRVQYIAIASTFLTKTFENTGENELKIALSLKTDKLIMIMGNKTSVA